MAGKRSGEKVLDDIRQLILERRFQKAFEKLEKAGSETKERTPARAFLYGAISLFGLGHIRQAESRVHQYILLSGEDEAALYMKAYLALHIKKYDEALLYWTRILEMSPASVGPDRLIKRLETGGDRLWKEIQNPSDINEFIPVLAESDFGAERTEGKQGGPVSHRPTTGSRKHKKKKSISPRLLAIAISGLIVTVGSLGGVALASDRFAGWLEGIAINASWWMQSDGLPELPVSGFVHSQGEYTGEAPEFMYESPEQVLEDFRLAKDLIHEGRVNEARKLIGKIELSNAGFRLKERATLLRDFIPFLEKDRLKDSLPLARFLEEPYMYRGAQVSWQGEMEKVDSGNFLFHPRETPESAIGLVPDDSIRPRWQNSPELQSSKRQQVEILGQIFSSSDGGVPYVAVREAVFFLRTKL